MAKWRVIYKRTWGDRKIRKLSEGAELHFVKLISVADDRGFIEAEEVLTECYPGRVEITQEIIDIRNRELVEADLDAPLLIIHRNGQRTILQLPNFEKRQVQRPDRLKDSELRVLVDKWQPLVDKCQPLVDKCPPTVQYSTVQDTRKSGAKAPPSENSGKTEKPPEGSSSGNSSDGLDPETWDRIIAAVRDAWHQRRAKCRGRGNWLHDSLIRGLIAICDRQWQVSPVALISLLPETDKDGQPIANHWAYITQTAKNGTDRPYWVEGADTFGNWLCSITPDRTPDIVRQAVDSIGKPVPRK
jgi:hypothetical protein